MMGKLLSKCAASLLCAASVLSLLAGEDMYGYKMIVELARRSNHTFDMKEGTLYPVLHGLEQEGFVEAYRKQAPTGRERKYYRLTRDGQERYDALLRTWREMRDAVATLGVQ